MPQTDEADCISFFMTVSERNASGQEGEILAIALCRPDQHAAKQRPEELGNAPLEAQQAKGPSHGGGVGHLCDVRLGGKVCS